MRLYIFFLIAATFSKEQITVYHLDGSSNAFDATPGDCRVLNGTTINNISVPPGLVVKFFSDEGCKGDQLGFGFGNYKPYENQSKIKSLKVLNGPGHQPNNEAYYDMKYNSNYIISDGQNYKKLKFYSTNLQRNAGKFYPSYYIPDIARLRN
jgi:hypothetical protein